MGDTTAIAWTHRAHSARRDPTGAGRPAADREGEITARDARGFAGRGRVAAGVVRGTGQGPCDAVAMPLSGAVSEVPSGRGGAFADACSRASQKNTVVNPARTAEAVGVGTARKDRADG